MYVLSPVGQTKAVDRELPIAAPVSTLDGKVVGFLDNSKPNNDLLQARLEEMLREHFAVAGVVRQRKPSAQQGAPAASFAELDRADVVINGIGD